MTEILLEIYEEYNTSKTITKLEEFTYKTFPQDGTDKLFIACVLILINSVYKSRLSGETLATVVQSAKEKVNNTNLLEFYQTRVNENKLISKYLVKVVHDENLEKYADLILEYLKERSFDFTTSIKEGYSSKLQTYSVEKID